MTVQQPNLDPREIDRFAKMADDWWNPKGQFRPLHKIGPARIEFIRNCLTRHFGLTGGGIRPLKGLRLLDVGCGGGLIAEPLARLGAEVTGIDPGEDTVAAARIHAAQQGVEIDYRATTIETLEATGEKFDVVTALEVVEHVPEPAVEDGPFRMLVWKQSPPPVAADRLELPVLLFAPEGELGERLVAQLRGAGCRLTVVTAGESFAASDSGH